MNDRSTAKSCPVCMSEMRFSFTAQVLNKYKVSYFNCPSCGLIQTEKPFWLDEAYDEAISILDTGIVGRNLSIGKSLTPLLLFLFGKNGRYLDTAGGYGLLTRIMRDYGFDFFWQDPYCQNLFAKGFEASPLNRPFNAVTAFEVLEHIEDPLTFINENLKYAQSEIFICSTYLYHGQIPRPGQWWYYAHETGQHITFYSKETLSIMAKRLSMKLFSNGSIHMFSKNEISSVPLLFIASTIGKLLDPLYKAILRSKVMPDHEYLKKKMMRRR